MQAQLDDWIAQEDGSYLVTASLLTYSDAEGSSNRTFQFILNDNGYKDELPDPLFYYTISNVSPMDDSFSDLTQETEENSPGQEPSTQIVSELNQWLHPVAFAYWQKASGCSFFTVRPAAIIGDTAPGTCGISS